MRFKLWLNIITLGAVVVLLFFARADIMEVWRQMQELNLWVLALMIPMQFVCFFAIAKVYQSYLQAAREPKKVPMKGLFSLGMEVNFVHHVFPSAGVSAFSYVSLRMKQFNLSAARATMLQLVRTAFSFIAFIPLILIGLILLSFEDRASNFIIFVASSLATLITLGTVMMVYVLGSKKRIHTAAQLVAHLINRAVYFISRKHPEAIKMHKLERSLDELQGYYLDIRRDFSRTKATWVWAIVSNICELTLVYIVFLAHGEPINPGALIIAFAVANLAGLIALLPGGVGVYESLMIGTLVSSGVSANLALSAILVYRVIGTLLSLPTGYVFYHKAIQKYGTTRS